MAEREDSIHLRIRIDVDEEDKLFTENLASNLAKTDEEKVAQQVRDVSEKDYDPTPTFSEHVKKYLKEEIKKINKEIRGAKPEDIESLKEKLKIRENSLKLKQIKESPVSIIQNMTQKQLSNLMQMVSNPTQFLMGAFFKNLGKIGARAARVGVFAVLLFFIEESVKFFINELMKPGRAFDRRFRRVARDEVMNFYDRQLQEDIRQTYEIIRVSTVAGLRGGKSQVNSNLFQFGTGKQSLIASTPFLSSHDISQGGYINGSPTTSSGNIRRRTVSGRFG